MISDDSWRTDEERPPTVVTSSAAYQAACKANLLTHYVMPGTTETLCCEQVRPEDWLVVRADQGIDVPVGCHLCRQHRYWLPASGELERNAILEVVIEPHELGVRKHVTGNDDPERGRFHRPETLQICLTCGMLRGPYAGFDNLCSCDRARWEGARWPRCGDLSNSAHLCCTCTVNIVRSETRWSVFHCDECRPATQGLRERLVGNPIPWGWHSLTNGIGLRGDVASKLEPAGWTAFHDQLQAQFSNQSRMFDLTKRRTLERAAMLGFDGPAVSYGDYRGACKEIGFGPRQGFEEFLGHVLGQPDPALAAAIWDDTPE